MHSEGDDQCSNHDTNEDSTYDPQVEQKALLYNKIVFRQSQSHYIRINCISHVKTKKNCNFLLSHPKRVEYIIIITNYC